MIARLKPVCEGCGRTWKVAKPTKAIYCSDACRQRSYRERKAERDRRAAAARPKAKPAPVEQVSEYQPMLTPAQLKQMREVIILGDKVQLYPVLKMNGTQALNPDGKPLWRTQAGKRLVIEE
jgi:hypothetical protein